MRKVTLALIASAAFIVGAFVTDQAISFTPAPKLQPAQVKLVTNTGHGSAVHIGDGYYLTAAHVVLNAKELKIKTKDTLLRDATVLWANKEYDIALVKASGWGIDESPLLCAPVPVGTNIRAFGNPTLMEFVYSSGKIAGEPFTVGPWHSVYPVDITIVPGQSGGPVYNDRGQVIGITVGVFTLPTMMGMSITGFGAVVPSSTVCELLAR